jgi:uncharacterized GH25 family protein
MKKALSILIIALVMFFSTVSVFAHPEVPTQSLNKVSEKAAMGLHTAWGNVQDADGVAAHVFMFRLSPH